MRQHLDLALGFQIADEWNAQLQILELMLALHRLVIEFHAPITQCDVVERKVHRLGRLLVLRLGEFGDHIINVELAQRILGQAHHRRIDLNGIQNGRQTEDGLRAGVDKNTLDLQLRLRCRGQVFLPFSALRISAISYFFDSFINHQIVNGDRQGPWRKLHLAHMHTAPQLVGGLLFQLTFGHPGHQRPEQQPQQQNGRNKPDQPAQPAVRCE